MPHSDSLRCTATHLSLVGEAVGANEALVELDRGFGVAWLVLVPEVDVEEPKPLRETFVPLKVVQEGPGRVAFHVHTVLDSCQAKQEVDRTVRAGKQNKHSVDSNVFGGGFSPFSISLM